MKGTVAPDRDMAELTQPASWVDRNRLVVALGLAWARRSVERYIAGFAAASRPASTDEAVAALAPEPDWLLREPRPLPAGDPISSDLDNARQAYDDARDAMRAAGAPAAIDHLSMAFELTPFDEDVLLLSLASRTDAAFQVLYGRAHTRSGLTRATPHLVVNLLVPDNGARAEAFARLGPAGSLRRWVLIEADESGVDALSPLELDERIAGYLLGRDDLDARARACLRPVVVGPSPARHAHALDALAQKLLTGSRAAALIIGPRASGRRAAAAELAARLGLGLAEVEPRAVPTEAVARRARFALIAREGRLGRFAVLIDLSASTLRSGSDDLQRLARELADDALGGLNAVLLLTADERIQLATPVPTIHLQPIDASDRVAVWHQVLGTRSVEARIVERVADQFALDPDEIASIAAAAPEASEEGLWTTCRQVAGRGLEGMAERIEPRFTWDDIVLPAVVLDDLFALVAQVRHRLEVYRDWGFDHRLPRGRGVTALFSGASGVGKTMAAEVVAGALGLDLYRIDLSNVVSKYIGETEKNLRRVFDTAEAGGAVLFFDEADALFGKRSEVRDSHDRYANIEVSYLLQRMEAYAGLAILATNLKSHLDTAFLRRLRYVIDIPFPDASLRRAIWTRAFPAAAPTVGLDLDALARLEIPGGNITVIAVNAAFLAAADQRAIDMSHIARAARAEFRKLDKECRLPWAESR